MSSDDFAYVTSGDVIGIPLDASTIQVNESAIVYFNVVDDQHADDNKVTTETELIQLSLPVESECVSDVIIKCDDTPVGSLGKEVEENVDGDEIVDDPSDLHACPHCKAFFTTAAYLKAHMKRKCIRAENVNNKYACGYCTLSFKQRFQLTLHMRQHTGERPFKCTTCAKTFLTKSHLKRHDVIHLPRDQLKHKCDQCDKVFAWPSALESHLKSHNGERRFKCGICARTFLHTSSLKVHTINKHTVNGKYACVVCKECFSEATELITHMKTHNDDESVKCARCSSFFTSLGDLETHVCTNFGGNPLLCAKCGVEFQDTATYCDHPCMQVNVNRVCGCCSKNLNSLWHLREHLITHTGEKPYKCHACLRAFRRKRELQIHVTRHGNGKPFPCSRCSLTFSSDTYLKQHIRKEHREKKFVCGICEHTFMYQCALTNHMTFHYRTGNKKFGKKYHRDEGLLVEELVKERLEKEKGIDTELGIARTSSKPNSPVKIDNFVVNQDENITVDDTIGLQEETFSSESNGNYGPSCAISSVMTACADGNLSNKVIEPRIDLRNAEQDPSYITTIYQTDGSGSLIIRCASCYHHFPSHTALLRHRKDQHNDGKPYQCNFCSRTFSVAANLSQHQSIHNTKRKYGCTECGRSYKVTHKVREHLKLKHAICTEHLTDLDLDLKYGLSSKNDPQTKRDYISNAMPIEKSENIDFRDANSSKLPLLSNTSPAKVVECESEIESYDISKVTSGIIYLEAKGDDLPSAVAVDELCTDDDVSFIITKFINNGT